MNPYIDPKQFDFLEALPGFQKYVCRTCSAAFIFPADRDLTIGEIFSLRTHFVNHHLHLKIRGK